MNTNTQQDSLNGIAIIGMAGRFPGAANVSEFWRNVRNGVESVTFFTDEELLAAGVAPELLKHPDYVRAKAILADAELFDAAFFGFTPREATVMDPQQRVFLECAWEALENAGYRPQAPENSTGVFAGASINSYGLRNLHSDLFRTLDGLELGLSTDKDFLTTRVSYKLNLKGPSVVVQTACSTSLVAVCQACQSLLNYQCDMALAGGSSVKIPRVTGYVYKQGAIASPDGHCRTFDANAHGTITGEGVGVVVLKRLEDALVDGDTIHAVIKGFAINNDGSLKVGYTAPSVDGQAEVIAMAQAFAGVHPDSISYVEAHGTGTDLGDPIEIAALTQAFRASTQRRRYCPIGSVKTNIGHLDAAAGVTGLIKTAMALEHRELPPSLHFEKPNPEIDFENSPFYVVDRLTPWAPGPTPRRAGVSSFGIGGTNAHVVLEEAPATEPSGPSRPWQLVVLAARTESALDASVGRLAAHLKEHKDQVFADVAHTLQVGRRDFDWRAVAVCRDGDDAYDVLNARVPQRLQRGRVPGKERPVVFMFTGQGSQYPHMGEGLYRDEAVYRQVVDECLDILRRRAGLELKAVLYPAGHDGDKEAAERLRDTGFAQPALFVTEYALARLWMSFGIRPAAMVGHSVGEYVAACLAGVMSLEDALVLVAARGRLVSGLEGGSMLAVPLPEQEVLALLGDSLCLAAVNTPQLCVVSGPTPGIERLEGELRGRGLEPVRLHTSHAFHSWMMEPILPEFARNLAKVKLNKPGVPFVSNVNGNWITGEQAVDPQYWVAHLREGVRFSAGVACLLEDDKRVFLEVGPGSTLAGLVRQHLKPGTAGRAVSSMRSARDDTQDQAQLLEAVGKLWLAGVVVDWKSFSGNERRRRVPLPAYPFERQRYWVDSGKDLASLAAPVALRKQTDITEWLYVPAWKQTPSPSSVAGSTGEPRRWLLFADEGGLAGQLAQRLAGDGESVLVVHAGREFGQRDDSTYCLDPGNAAHFEKLFSGLMERGGIPANIVHLWSLTGDREGGPVAAKELLARSFWSPIGIARAIGRIAAGDRFEITLVSDGMQAVTGDENLRPEKATILGPCRVVSQEYPGIVCRSVDLVLPGPGSPRDRRVLDQLCAELRSAPSQALVAYRGVHRWARSYEPVRVPAPEGKPARLRDKGVYLITGGLGGIGLAIAGYLAKNLSARLVLVGRTRLPEAGTWDLWLGTHAPDDRTSTKIRRIRALEETGAQVMIASADVASRDEMQKVIKAARERFGEIHGVVHSAGVPAGGIIELKTPESANATLSPKVQGTLVLDELFGNTRLDFMVLCSSLTAILGGGGQVDYTAANAFLDAYAHAKANVEGRLTVSIEWDAWSETGMAVETEVPSDMIERRRKDLEQGIRDAEGVDVFCRVLNCSLPQVLVSTRDLIRRMTPVAAPSAAPAAGVSTEAPAAGTGHARPSLSTDYVAPRNDTERAVAVAWQELFGIEQMGINDNFLEAGGHSLLAIQIVSRIGRDLGVKLPVNVVFESPTIAEIAAQVETLRRGKADDDRKLAEVLEMVEQLSDEEVNRLLAEKVSGK